MKSLLRNPATRSVVRARDGYTLNVCTPSANRVGSTLTWQIQIDAGANATLYYEWEHNW